MARDTRQRANERTAPRQAPDEAQPRLHERGLIVQPAGSVRHLPIGLSADVRAEQAEALNQVLADTLMLYHLYKRAHWHVAGHTFYQLHLLFDKHAGEQLELVDEIAERVQSLGGVAMGMPQDVVERTNIPPTPKGAEEAPASIDRLLDAHERLLLTARGAAHHAQEQGDDGTNDLLVSDVIRTNELQVWFLSEHVVDAPATPSKGGDGKRA
jgi:starvation-inducible DNA-binding protein